MDQAVFVIAFAGWEVATAEGSIDQVVQCRPHLLVHLSWGDVVRGLEQDCQDASYAMGRPKVNLLMPGPHKRRPATHFARHGPPRHQDC